MNVMNKRIAFVLAMVALAAPTSAYAASGDPVGPTYSKVGGVVENNVNGADEPTAAGTQSVAASNSNDGGRLPFTGFDIGIAAGAGLLLLTLGLGMRFLARGQRVV